MNRIIKTSRITIIPRTKEELQELIENEVNNDLKKAYQEMLDLMITLGDNDYWATDWKIIFSNEIIGGIGYKGLPVNETVEIGYGIESKYQNQGFATEAVSKMIEWAFTFPEVNFICAQTEIENIISQKVLLNNGFIRDGYGPEGPRYIKKR